MASEKSEDVCTFLAHIYEKLQGIQFDFVQIIHFCTVYHALTTFP